MASKAVMDAVETRLASVWSHTPIRTPNDGNNEPPADGSAFLVVQYPAVTETLMGVGSPGSNYYQEEGAIRFVLAIPAGAGRSTWDARIDTLRGEFRGKVLDAAGLIKTYEASPPIAADDNDDGLYYALSFAVRYTADIFG